MTETSVERVNDQKLDKLELAIINHLSEVDCPVKHIFCKGMYIREIFMPKGTLLTSKIHKTEHPYTVSKGAALVSIDGGIWEEIKAPHTGITKVGTRRVLYITEDCTWSTYHRYKTIQGSENQLSEVEQQAIVDRIEGRIIEKHINALTGEQHYGVGSSSRSRCITGR